MSFPIPASLIERLMAAHSVVAFTGAGMSAESGVPTFRGSQGIWTRFRPEELANLQAFLRNPALVWEWYSARKRIIAEVSPNAGHRALAEFDRLFPSVTVITQNIDNLHRRAGSERVFELHGNIERNYCLDCGKVFTDEEVRIEAGVPACSSCGGLVRPDVVWFGEILPMDQWECSVRSAESADVLLSVGTSGVVYPAAEIPRRAKRNGACVVEINVEETEASEIADEILRGSSAEVLPALRDAVTARRGVSEATEGKGTDARPGRLSSSC